MSDIKWIKLSVSMFEDEKIKLIESMPESDAILVIWIRLLAMAGKTNDTGMIYLSPEIPYTDEMLATLFNKPLNTIRFALEVLSKYRMIDITSNHFIYIENWSKHQNIEGMEQAKKLRAARNKRYYEKKKLLEESSDEKIKTSYKTEQDTLEEEKEIELDKDKEEKNNIPYTEIIQYLNQKVSKQFNPKTEGHRKHIRARWNEGYTVDDFKTVIDKKVAQWKDAVSQDGKPLSDYLRPSTLFSQKHFDNYLNESVKGGTNNAKAGEKGSFIDQYDF